MDFHAAMETFAEAWMAANTQTTVNPGPGAVKQTTAAREPPTSPHKEQPADSSNENPSDDVKDHNDNSPGDETGERSECLTPTDPRGSMSSPAPRASPVTAAMVSPAPTPKIYPSSKTPSPRKPESVHAGTGGRSLPVHCIIEQINGGNNGETTSTRSCDPSTVELDSYAILPANTPIHDLVCAALAKLGYSSADGSSAKGAIQLKNWKPLSFEVITDDKMATIDDILGELINSATLRIRLSSQPKLSSADEMKEKLLQLLLTQSHSLLLESGCPIEKTLLMSISKGDNSPALPEDLSSAFNTWYNNQIQKNAESNGHSTSKGQTSSSDSDDKDKSENGSPREMDVDRQPVLSGPKAVLERKSSSSSSAASTSTSSSSQSSSQSFSSTSGHSSSQQHNSNIQMQSQSQGAVLTPSKTRIRTSFDPEHEIPRLQKWFTDNQHPTREQMVRYMNELNNLESRKGRRPLDLTNIIYWFKNARAAQRRASKALDDSFENEENVDVNGGHPAVAASPSEPPPVPYLPNKNAVYVIPFPYHSPHSAHPHHMLSDSMSEAYDEPCDLSIKKLRDTPTFSHMESRATPNGRSRSEGLSQNGESNKPISNSRKRSPVRGSYSVKTISREDGSGHKSPAACNGFPENLGSGKSIPSVVKDMVVNGHDNGHKFLQSHYAEVKDSDSGEPGPLLTGMKEEVASDDDDNSVHSDESDGGGRLKINEDEDEIDYGAPHMRNGLGIGVGGGGMVVSAAESSAASMAALSLAQMSQPLHIPQLAPHLAMYYPMAPRYYPPPPSHHAQSSAAATAAMVAALSNSAHLSSKASSSANSITTNNVTASGHPSTSNRPVPIQPAPHPPLSTPHGHPHGRSEPRKRRTRVFIDPLTEIPKLEKWFLEDTHPSAYMIDKYTEALNAAEYRQKFPKLEPKNIQLWFKNHRAKVKRMRMGLEMEDSYCDSPPPHGARSSPLPDSGSREEMSSSSPERASSSSKNDDESPGGSGGDNGNEEELMDEDAQ